MKVRWIYPEIGEIAEQRFTVNGDGIVAPLRDFIGRLNASETWSRSVRSGGVPKAKQELDELATALRSAIL